MSEITSASLAWVNVAFKSPHVYRLPTKEGPFRIATYFGNQENIIHSVISGSTWLDLHVNGWGNDYYAAVDVSRQDNGKYKVTVNRRSRNFLFDVRSSGPVAQNSERRCTLESVELNDGDVFELGIDHHLWTSLGDSGLGTFQIRYELDDQPPIQEVPSGTVNRARLEKMPSEVLMTIFEYLPLEDVVLNLPCVCRRFFEVLTERVKRKDLNVKIASNTTLTKKPYFFPCEMGLIAKLVLGNTVESLAITVNKHVDNVRFPAHLLSFIGEKCVSVTIRYHAGVEVNNSLEKNYCFDMVLRRITEFEKVDTLVYIWPNFASNDLNSGSNWPVVRSVKNLSVRFDSDNEVVKAEQIVVKFPNLERLQYQDDKPRGIPGFWSNTSNEGPGIRWTALTVNKYPDSVAWNRCQELQTVELRPSDHFHSAEFFEQCAVDFNQMPHVKHLFLRLPDYMWNDQVLTLAGQFPVNVEVLMLDCGSFQCDENRIQIIERLASRCTKVVTLYLKYFANINLFDAMRIYEAFPCLTRLFVNDPEDPDSMCSLEWTVQNVPGSLCFTRNPAMDDLDALFFW